MLLWIEGAEPLERLWTSQLKDLSGMRAGRRVGEDIAMGNLFQPEKRIASFQGLFAAAAHVPKQKWVWILPKVARAMDMSLPFVQ